MYFLILPHLLPTPEPLTELQPKDHFADLYRVYTVKVCNRTTS